MSQKNKLFILHLLFLLQSFQMSVVRSADTCSLLKTETDLLYLKKQMPCSIIKTVCTNVQITEGNMMHKNRLYISLCILRDSLDILYISLLKNAKCTICTQEERLSDGAMFAPTVPDMPRLLL